MLKEHLLRLYNKKIFLCAVAICVSMCFLTACRSAREETSGVITGDAHLIYVEGTILSIDEETHFLKVELLPQYSAELERDTLLLDCSGPVLGRTFSLEIGDTVTFGFLPGYLTKEAVFVTSLELQEEDAA